MPVDVLVIGYGNTLREDDGIGPAVAEGVAALHLPRVRAIIVHQLTPELAAHLVAVRVAVFVDAAVGGEAVTAVRIEAASDGDVMTHAADPQGLLALGRAVYGRCPDAWLVTAAGKDFGFREGLSDTGRNNANRALDRVERLIREAPRAEAASRGLR